MENIQEYIALLIVFAAFGYAMYSGILIFTMSKKDNCGNGCNCHTKIGNNKLVLNKKVLKSVK
ncbi:MAG: hypothetical protein U0W24_01115 [Bacteroidales bacterium]